LDATLEMRHWTCAVMANFFHTKHEPRHWTCAMMVNISHTKLELREKFSQLEYVSYATNVFSSYLTKYSG